MLDAITLLRRHNLFDGMSDGDLQKLNFRVYRRKAEAGEILVREGGLGCELFIIESGSVEVLRSGGGDIHAHRIASLSAGANFGELALLDNGPRSATVRATAPTELIVIDTKELGHPSATLEREHADIFRNLAKMLAARLRGTNNVTVAALERELELAEMRVEMANFCAAIILLLCGYGFVIRAASFVGNSAMSTTMLTLPVLLGFSGIVLWVMRKSRYPWSAFGITLARWKWYAVEAVVWTLPMMALITLVKWLLINNSQRFASEPLFNLGATIRDAGSHALPLALIAGVIYAVIVPLQELTARGALQGSLMLFLDGPNKTWLAILISNVVFTACHLHLSATFAMLAFFPGLVWGMLYARQRSIVGVSVSHILLGVWAFSFLGLEAVLPV